MQFAGGERYSKLLFVVQRREFRVNGFKENGDEKRSFFQCAVICRNLSFDKWEGYLYKLSSALK